MFPSPHPSPLGGEEQGEGDSLSREMLTNLKKSHICFNVLFSFPIFKRERYLYHKFVQDNAYYLLLSYKIGDEPTLHISPNFYFLTPRLFNDKIANCQAKSIFSLLVIN